eukprot:CAMPEP_0185730270 /NCGR_PEP_ID=MMETSP1171-20130828/9180_1 /TAXON_ID=374046 /ORGANISM="Helicotheca tamensis, Strain CCMP826" /LENGTH=578 /DNA_ID=CAMNT_0028399285 /DNA_START=409 /DNA_END=2145 /DNA_ORIENTATION=+
MPRKMSSSSSESASEADNADIEYVEADDGEALQKLFAKQCDEDGLMTQSALRATPAIRALLVDGDLLSEELDDIWSAAPKFPDVSSNNDEERIDVDSFIQVYRDIDDLFEDDEEEETSSKTEPASDDDAAAAAAAKEVVEKTGGGDDEDEEGASPTDETNEDQTIAEDEEELEKAFATICDGDNLVSRDALRQWDEVKNLLEEGMLGEDEFGDIWDRTPKSLGSSDKLIDVDGFLSFNVALDDLFVFDDDEVEDEAESDTNGEGEAEEDVEEEEAAVERPMVEGDDLPPGVIFSALADEKYQVGMKELKRWGELQDMLTEGDILPIELQNIYAEVPKVPGTKEKIDEDGFLALYEAIEALFEDEDEAGDEAAAVPSVKPDLLSLLLDIAEDETRIPCGLDCTEREEREISDIVAVLEQEPTNKVITQNGIIETEDIIGTWDLLYSSSATMKYNEGLSGLAGGVSKFSGLKQKLEGNKYISDAEYIETIDIPGDNSFDVRVTAGWELRNSVSLFTGKPSTVLKVTPEMVYYGPTKQVADYWKSLGPMSSTDLTYLDDDLRVMRGTTSTDSIFILKKNDS